jgi:membrane protein implicated in regulation of membrane protease activity
MMKTRIMTVILFLATMQFIALGLLFLLRLHYRFFGFSFLVLGALTLFIAERYRRRVATKEPPNSHENSPAGTGGSAPSPLL